MRMRYRTLAHKTSGKYFLLDILEASSYFATKELIEKAQNQKPKRHRRTKAETIQYRWQKNKELFDKIEKLNAQLDKSFAQADKALSDYEKEIERRDKILKSLAGK